MSGPITLIYRRRISPCAERNERRRLSAHIQLANAQGIKPRIIVKGGK